MTEPAKCHCGSISWERNIEERRYTCCSCKRPLWQPIETAPKDFTYVLLWDGDWHWMGIWDENGNRWEIDGHEYEENLIPTHWMPLPEPPK